LSIRTPVSFPFDLTNSPPSIFDDLSIPARFNAKSLTKYACPSILLRTIALSGNSSFNNLLVGNDLLSQSFWSQPLPIIKSLSLELLNSITRFKTSSKLLVSLRFT
jgi:hypothetical protein